MNNKIDIFAPLSLEERRFLRDKAYKTAYNLSQDFRIKNTEALDLSLFRIPLSIEAGERLSKKARQRAYNLSKTISN